MKKLFFCLLLFLITTAYSQHKYPQGYFQNPVEIPMYLSGTFGELRTNHFHSGLDIKTKGTEGLNVLASAAGYVSRIRTSHWGYGKALYITHPNGYTTVYAHLKKFNPKIEAYLKKQQYKKETYEIQLFPSKDELVVEKGEVVAFSGSTGGFVGPHLHFEIRDGNSNPINPMHFGITVKDDLAPLINTLVAYPIDSLSQINQSAEPLQINFKMQSQGYLLADKITASGAIGLGINTYDLLNGALNKNGIYSLQMLVNGQQTYYHDVETFSFAETKYINLLIDYNRNAELKQRIQRCFVVPRNLLGLNYNNINNGFLIIKDSLDYKVEIIAKDFKGNQKKLVIPIQGKKETIKIHKKVKKTDYYIDSKVFNKFTQNGVIVAFPKNTFYKDFYLDFKVENGKATIHKKNIPLHLKYTLTFDVSDYSENDRKQLFIAGYNSKGTPTYKSTTKKVNTFYTTTKELGEFKLLKDSIKPKIRLSNFKDKQWLSNFRRISLKVSDDFSGVKSYRGEIDGEWILLEYNPKHSSLTYEFADKTFSTAKHNLKVKVEDFAGNTNTLEATFYRKK